MTQPAVDVLTVRLVEAVPRLALTLDESAAALGISRDSFDRYVRPDIRVLRQGKLVTVPVDELRRYVDEKAARVLA